MSAWQWVSDTFSWLGYQFAKFRYGQNHWRPYLLMCLVPMLGYFLYQIIFHRRRHQPGVAVQATPAPGWPGLDSEFYLLEEKLARRGLVRRPGESPADWLRQAASDPGVAGMQDPLRQLLRLHYQYRFGPHGLTEKERKALRQQAQSCLAALGNRHTG